METRPLTNEDRSIFDRLMRQRTETLYMVWDRQDGAIMRSAQRYYMARAICQFGGTEQDAIQVR